MISPISCSGLVIIGGVPLESSSDFLRLWRPTFETYLSETVGIKYSPPLRFSLITLTLSTAFDMVEAGKVNFTYSNPSLFSCLQAEYSVLAMATLRKKVGNGESALFGGIIFVRADDKSVNDISDLRGKVVAASSILLMGAGQTQWQEMRKAGLDLLVDPAQVIFVGYDQSKVVEEVLLGRADVGLVRTGYIEGMVAQNRTRQSLFKYINVQAAEYPFPVCTALYPEWPLAATRGVDRDLVVEVAAALMRINASHPAAFAGAYSAWDPPMSYSSAAFMNADLGIYNRGKGKCVRDLELYGAIACPAGHYKRPRNEVDGRCAALGRPCPSDKGYACLCSPCRKQEELELFRAENSIYSNESKQCIKMEICAQRQQKQQFMLLVVDNLLRMENLNLTYRLHTHPMKYGTADRIQSSPSYSMNISTTDIGTYILEIFHDGFQIPSSPFLIEVERLICIEDNLKVANAEGECVCRPDSMLFVGQCIMLSVLLPAIIAPVFMLFLILGYIFHVYTTNKLDVSIIRLSELVFANPAEVLGQGTFGLVLKADYHGTHVAVKKAVCTSSKSDVPDNVQLSKRELEAYMIRRCSVPAAFDNSESSVGSILSSFQSKVLVIT